MSIHHEVAVHCDGCGHWEQGNHGGVGSGQTTRRRRAQGWVIWRLWGDSGPWMHLCPDCSSDPERRTFAVAHAVDPAPIPEPSNPPGAQS